MNYNLDTKLLAKKLLQAPNRKLPDYVGELNEVSTGAAYLFSATVISMLKGGKPSIADIEMDRFDYDDIDIVCSYLEEKVIEQDEALKPIFLFNDITESAKPISKAVKFV